MDLSEQAQYVADCFITLTDQEIDEVFDEWAKGTYRPGEDTTALADLMRMLQNKSLTDEQRNEEKQRLALPTEK